MIDRVSSTLENCREWPSMREVPKSSSTFKLETDELRYRLRQTHPEEMQPEAVHGRLAHAHLHVHNNLPADLHPGGMPAPRGAAACSLA